MDRNKVFNDEMFRRVLRGAHSQAFQGKGIKRHGIGDKLYDQHFFYISQSVGPQFLLGQAVKKLMEIRSKETLKEVILEAEGAIVYTVLYILYRIYQEGTDEAMSLLKEIEDENSNQHRLGEVTLGSSRDN